MTGAGGALHGGHLVRLLLPLTRLLTFHNSDTPLPPLMSQGYPRHGDTHRTVLGVQVLFLILTLLLALAGTEAPVELFMRAAVHTGLSLLVPVLTVVSTGRAGSADPPRGVVTTLTTQTRMSSVLGTSTVSATRADPSTSGPGHVEAVHATSCHVAVWHGHLIINGATRAGARAAGYLLRTEEHLLEGLEDLDPVSEDSVGEEEGVEEVNGQEPEVSQSLQQSLRCGVSNLRNLAVVDAATKPLKEIISNH